MTDSLDSRTTMPAADAAADELAYRAVSPAAILVFVLGVVSAAAFFSPLLWTLPVVTIGLGWFTLRRLAQDADRYTGAALARAGTLLAILFLGWAPARHLQRVTILETRAAAVAQDWVKLVAAGRLEEAHQWHLSAASRAPAGTSISAFYAERPELVKSQQEYFQLGPLQHWMKRGPGTEAHYVGFVGREWTANGENYVFEFSVRGGKGSGDLPAFVVISREPREDGSEEMFVASVLGVNPFTKER